MAINDHLAAFSGSELYAMGGFRTLPPLHGEVSAGRAVLGTTVASIDSDPD